MLLSSVNDLIKWDAALTGHALIDVQSLTQMWTPTRLSDGHDAEYGYGWQTSKVNGHRQVAHGGGIPGFSTEFSRFPDDKLTVIVLTNAEGGHAGAIARKVAGQLVPELAEKAEGPIADEDTATTARLRRMFEGALKGEVDEGLFNDEAKKQLVPRIRGDKERLASFGAMKSFQLLERKKSDGGQRLRYRMVLENETLKLFIAPRQGRQDPGGGDPARGLNRV